MGTRRCVTFVSTLVDEPSSSKLARATTPRAPEVPVVHYTPELAARKKMIELAIVSETELYRERMAAYGRQLADIEREGRR